MNIAKKFGLFINRLDFESLPGDVVQKAKENFLDYLGVSLYGFRLKNHLPFLKAVLEEGSTGNLTVIGEGKKFTSYRAIFLNSILSHSTAYEDGSRFAAVHPASVVIPAAMSLCEKNRSTGRDFITALTAGYEVMIRLGRAVNPSAVNRGFHPTGITGAFGSAAAAAKIYRLSPAEAEAALNIAASQGAGLMQAFDAARSQPLHTGRSSAAGVFCAVLGRSGTEGPAGIIQSFLKAHSDEYSPDGIMVNIGKEFKIKETYIKFHGGCRHIHAPIDAAKAIVMENGISTSDIEKIEIKIYRVAKDLDKEHPATVGDALFSTSFGIAVALLDGDAFIDRFSDQNLSRPEVWEIMNKVEVLPDPEWDRVYPLKRGCRCEIRTRRNQSYALSLDFARGEPELPFSPAEIKEKYMRLAAPATGLARAEKIYEYVQGIDRLDDFSEFMNLLNQA